jgi:hypothetical protein
MRIVSVPKEWRIPTEEDIVKLHKADRLLNCAVCDSEIDGDNRFKTIVEHNDGAIRDQESKPICYDCFDKFRIGFTSVRKKLARYDEFQQSTGSMRVKTQQ